MDDLFTYAFLYQQSAYFTSKYGCGFEIGEKIFIDLPNIITSYTDTVFGETALSTQKASYKIYDDLHIGNFKGADSYSYILKTDFALWNWAKIPSHQVEIFYSKEETQPANPTSANTVGYTQSLAIAGSSTTKVWYTSVLDPKWCAFRYATEENGLTNWSSWTVVDLVNNPWIYGTDAASWKPTDWDPTDGNRVVDPLWDEDEDSDVTPAFAVHAQSISNHVPASVYSNIGGSQAIENAIINKRQTSINP